MGPTVVKRQLIHIFVFYPALAILLSIPMGLGVYWYHFGQVVKEWPLPTAGQPLTQELALLAGDKRQFSVYVEKIVNLNCRQLKVDLQLLQKKQTRYRFGGTAFVNAAADPDGSYGIISKATTLVADLQVDAGGVDSLQLDWTLQPPDCKATIQGLVLQLRVPRL